MKNFSKAQVGLHIQIGILIGIAVSSTQTYPLLIFILTIAFILNKKSYLFWILMVSVLLGSSLSLIFKQPGSFADSAINQSIEVRGQIKNVERRREKQRIVLSYNNENVLVWADRYPEVAPDDVLHTRCTLQKPEPFNGFAYDKFLLTQGIRYECAFPKELKISTKDNAIISRTLFLFKQDIHKKITNIIPEPHATFLTGVLYGERSGFSDVWNDKFQKTGTTHILAISGYNITLVIVMMFVLLIQLRVPRKKSIWIVCGAIACFVAFVGFQASLIRASIMGMIPLIGQMMGRITHTGYVLLLATTLMVITNPLILIYDPAFQLSVTATAGLLFLTPKFTGVKWLPEKMGIKEIALATLSANIATLPLVMFHFGTISLASLIVNILVLPMIPLIMGTGMLMLILLMIHPFLGTMFGSLPYIIMTYVLEIISLFSQLPLASVTIHMPAWGVLLSYGILWKMSQKNSFKQLSHACHINGETWKIIEE